MDKSRNRLLIGLLIGILVSFIAYYYLIPTLLYPPQSKPMSPPKEYDYYIIIDSETGKTLTYVTSVRVSVGDEFISEDGHRYIVSKVEENRAYAQDFGPVDDQRGKNESFRKGKEK